VRSLENPVFQLKMALVASAIVVILLPYKNHRILAILSLSLWIGIVFAGRWIAYY
jgi:hypothetical protein